MSERANSSGHRMPAPSQFDVLAEELGLVAGRIEREAKLRLDALVATIERDRAEEKLRIVRLENELRERIAALKDGQPGPAGSSVTLDDVRPVIDAEVARRVAELPPAPAGTSITLDDVRPMLAEMVAALPPAEPGKTVTLDDVRPLIDEAVAAIPAPKDGTSVTLDDVRPLLQEMVSALPPAEPGKSVSLEDVRPLIESEVARRVAELPPAEPGKSVTVDDVRPVLAELVAALPPAEPGKQGEPGPQGLAGKLPIVVEWENKVYYEGECVTRDGSTYQALRDTGRDPSHEDWRCIARAGSDGLSFAVEGTYSAERTDYRKLSIVALNGGSFIAKRNDPGPCPGDGWQLIASQGKSGKPGDRGPSVKGDRGPAGPGVVAMSIGDQGLLTVVNGDGSTVELDLYPILSKLG